MSRPNFRTGAGCTSDRARCRNPRGQFQTKRTNKYHAQRTPGEGRIYDSRAERDFAVELALLVRAGGIADVEEQPVVKLVAGITYRPDFKFRELRQRRALGMAVYSLPVWVEVKGCETDRFRLIKKLWREFGPGVLRIVKRSGRRGGFVVVQEIAPRQQELS